MAISSINLVSFCIVYVIIFLKKRLEKDRKEKLFDPVFVDYSLTNEEYFDKVKKMSGFSQWILNEKVLKDAPRFNNPNPIKIGLIKPGIYINVGSVEKELKKENLLKIDFPTFCQFLIDNQEFAKENLLAIEWEYFCYACCREGVLRVSQYLFAWNDDWSFLGASN